MTPDQRRDLRLSLWVWGLFLPVFALVSNLIEWMLP